MLLVEVEVMPLIYLAIGFTFIGLFSPYKIFLLISLGPIIFLMYDYATIVDPHEGMNIVITSLAGWIIFNIYFALFGGSHE